MPFEEPEIDESALGDHASLLTPPILQQALDGTEEFLDYEILTHLSGATTPVSYKITDKMSDGIAIITEHSRTPWRHRSQFLRDGAYLLMRLVQRQMAINDPRLERYIIESEVERKLIAARTRMDSLRKTAQDLRALLLLHVEVGDIESAKKQLIEFWSGVAQVSEQNRPVYEHFFQTVPVIKYVAFLCGDTLPENLRPTEKEFQALEEADLSTDEGMPKSVEKEDAYGQASVVDSPESKEARKDYMRKYMKEYRAGRRRRNEERGNG